MDLTPETVSEALINHSYHFAKTMPQNPHWYTLRRGWNDDALFDAVVTFMRENSTTEYFIRKPFQMFYLKEYKYWTMGCPIPDTILINRAYTAEYLNTINPIPA